MPWVEWQKLAFGKMQISPDIFWSMSLMEWLLAIEGFREFHSPPEDQQNKPGQSNNKQAMSPDRLKELMRAAGE